MNNLKMQSKKNFKKMQSIFGVSPANNICNGQQANHNIQQQPQQQLQEQLQQQPQPTSQLQQ